MNKNFVRVLAFVATTLLSVGAWAASDCCDGGRCCAEQQPCCL
jgi:hypothetical protein